MSHSFTASRQDTPRGSYWEGVVFRGSGQNRGLRPRLPGGPAPLKACALGPYSPRPPASPSPVSPAPRPAHGSAPPTASGSVPRPAPRSPAFNRPWGRTPLPLSLSIGAIFV